MPNEVDVNSLIAKPKQGLVDVNSLIAPPVRQSVQQTIQNTSSPQSTTSPPAQNDNTPYSFTPVDAKGSTVAQPVNTSSAGSAPPAPPSEPELTPQQKQQQADDRYNSMTPGLRDIDLAGLKAWNGSMDLLKGVTQVATGNAFGINPDFKKSVDDWFDNTKQTEPTAATYKGGIPTVANVLGAGGAMVPFLGAFATGAGAIGDVAEAAGAAPAAASVIGTTATNMVLGYNQAYDDAKSAGVDNDLARNEYALTSTALGGMLFSALPALKTIKGFGEQEVSAYGAKELAKELAGGTETQQAVKNAISATMKFVTNTAENAGVMTGQEITNNIAQRISNISTGTDSFKTDIDPKQLMNSFIMNAITLAPLSGIEGYNKYAEKNTMQQQALQQAASNPEYYTSLLGQMQSEGAITPAQHENAVSNIMRTKQIFDAIPDDLPTEQKTAVAPLIEQKQDINNEMAGKDENFKPLYQQKVDEVNDKIKNVLNPQGNAEPTGETKGADNTAINNPVTDLTDEQVQGLTPEQKQNYDLIKEHTPEELPDFIKGLDKKNTVVTHGTDDNDANKVNSGTMPISLNEDGIKESQDKAATLADEGKKDVVATPVQRGQETAQIIADKTGGDVKTNENLGAWKIGDFEGKDEKSLDEKWFADHPDKTVYKPNATWQKEYPQFKGEIGNKVDEPFQAYLDRVIQSKKDIANEPASTVTVTHSKNARILKALDKHGEWNDAAKEDYLKHEDIDRVDIGNDNGQKVSNPIEETDAIKELKQKAQEAKAKVEEITQGKSKPKKPLSEIKSKVIERVEPETFKPDASKVSPDDLKRHQELAESLREGQGLLKANKDPSGNKLTTEIRQQIERSVESTKNKIRDLENKNFEPVREEVKAKVQEKAPEAIKSAKKEGVPMKVQKEDLLNQIQKAIDVVLGDRKEEYENVPKEARAYAHLESFMDDTSFKKLEDAGFNLRDSSSKHDGDTKQIVFDIEGDGTFALDAKGLDAAYEEVSRHWKVNEGNKIPKLSAKFERQAAEGKYDTLEKAKQSLQDASDNYDQAKEKSGSKELTEYFKKQLDFEKKSYQEAIKSHEYNKENLAEAEKLSKRPLLEDKYDVNRVLQIPELKRQIADFEGKDYKSEKPNFDLAEKSLKQLIKDKETIHEVTSKPFRKENGDIKKNLPRASQISLEHQISEIADLKNRLQEVQAENKEFKETPLQTAKQRVAEAKKNLNNLEKYVGIIRDPEEKAKRLVEYHKALVNLAKEYVKAGVNDVAEFAKQIGEKVTNAVQKAWDEANGKDKIKDAKDLGYDEKTFKEDDFPADNSSDAKAPVRESRTKEKNEQPPLKVEKNELTTLEQSPSGIKPDKTPENVPDRVQEATSTKNAVVNAERLENGQAPVTKIKAIDLEAIRNKVKEHLDNPDTYRSSDRNVNPHVLAQWSADNPRESISAWQEALLGGERDKLNTERELAFNSAEDAKQQGDMAKYMAMREQYLDKQRLIDINDKANSYRGTEWSNIGRQRQQMIKNDYSVDGLLKKYTVANDFRATPEDVEKKLRDAADKKVEYEKQIADLEKRNKELESDKARDYTVDKIKRDEKVKPIERGAKKVADIIRKLKVNVPELKDENGNIIDLKAKGVDWNDIVEGVAKAVEKGGKIADAILSNLKDVKWYNDLTDKGREAVQKQLNDILKAGLTPLEKLKEKIDLQNKEQVTPTLPQGSMIDMARELIRQGIKDPKEIVDGIHAQVKEILPDITHREVQDALSGYGKIKIPNKDPVEVQLRDVKAQLLTLSKIEAANKGKRPLKSGIQRDKPTAEQRLLTKELQRIMRKNGIEDTPQDREKKLQTALDARRTKLKNDIEEIDSKLEKIANGEHITPLGAKEPLPTDEQSKALKAERDTKKAQLDKLIEEGLTDDEKRAIAEDETQAKIKQVENSLNKRLEKLTEQNKTGQYTRREPATPISTTNIDLLRNKVAEQKKIADNIIRQRYLADRPYYKKFFDFMSDFQHSGLITSPSAAIKVLSNLPIQPIRNTIADIARIGVGVLPDLRVRPDISFTDNARAQIGSIAARWTTLTSASNWHDAWNAFLGKTTNVDRMAGEDAEMKSQYWGKQFEWLRKALNTGGINIHKASKTPDMNAEFAAALTKWNVASLAAGEDITNPDVVERNKQFALGRALSVAMMQKNFLSRWRIMIGDALDKKNPSGMNELAKFGLKTTFPIVKFPANYAADIGSLEGGLIQALVQAIHQTTPEKLPFNMGTGAGGFAKMSMSDRDLLVGRILKGSAGAALSWWAYTSAYAANTQSPVAFGGFYHTKQEENLLDRDPEAAYKQGILPLGGMRIGNMIVGENWITKLIATNPIFIIPQIAATTKAVEMAKHNKNVDVNEMAIGKTASAAVSSAPFLEGTSRTYGALTTHPIGGAVKSYAGTFVPAFIRQAYHYFNPPVQKPIPGKQQKPLIPTEINTKIDTKIPSEIKQQ